ncbi:hypothetical protein HRI_000576500 [Hibiscus trionum]|uniref:Fe2OG dioxygenase domain-containing protein n=1 Tax=Hibiscus trionum TaxID=183268 RepID=A0A9W7H1R2_HIBTR|nr:hypothetical protein HRI_000576500 [Hibiscus trionum]
MSSPAAATGLPVLKTPFMKLWVSMIWPPLKLFMTSVLSYRPLLRKETQLRNMLMDIGGEIAESMRLNGDYCKEWPCQFRINKYNFTPESVGTTGVQIHTDSGFLTILQDNENVGGLEVDKSGEFLPVDPLPGSLLVNLGDMANVWSNGRLHTVRHRVQCKEATIRVSMDGYIPLGTDSGAAAGTGGF